MKGIDDKLKQDFVERKHVMYFLLNIIFFSAKVDGKEVVPRPDMPRHS